MEFLSKFFSSAFDFDGEDSDALLRKLNLDKQFDQFEEELSRTVVTKIEDDSSDSNSAESASAPKLRQPTEEFKQDLMLKYFHLIPVRNSEGMSLMHIAAGVGSVDAIQWLDQYARDNPEEESAKLISELDNGGNTPLHIAAPEGNARVLTKLLQLMEEESILLLNKKHERASDLVTNENLLIFAEYDYFADSMIKAIQRDQFFKNEAKKAASQLEEEEPELVRTLSPRAEKSKELDKLNKRIVSQKDEIRQWQQKYSDAVSESKKLQGEAKKQLSEKNSDLMSAEKSLKKAEKNIETLTAENEKLKAKDKKSLQQQADFIKEIRSNENSKEAQFKSKLEEKLAEIKSLKKELAESNKKISELETSQSKGDKKLERELQQAKIDIQALNHNLGTMTKDRDNLLKYSKELESANDSLDVERRGLRQQNEQLRSSGSSPVNSETMQKMEQALRHKHDLATQYQKDLEKEQKKTRKLIAENEKLSSKVGSSSSTESNGNSNDAALRKELEEVKKERDELKSYFTRKKAEYKAKKSAEKETGKAKSATMKM